MEDARLYVQLAYAARVTRTGRQRGFEKDKAIWVMSMTCCDQKLFCSRREYFIYPLYPGTYICII